MKRSREGGRNGVASREIAAIWEAYVEAHDRGDPDGVARWFTEDAVVLTPGLPEVVGRDGFRELVSHSFSTATFEDLEIENRELQVRGDCAWQIAEFSETMRVEDGEARRLRGRFMVQWVREPEGWRIHRYISNRAPKE